MENCEVKRPRGRQNDCHSKWSKERYHCEIQGLGGQPNYVVGNFNNREDMAKALTPLMGIKISGQNLYDCERAKSKRYVRQILITKL